MVALTIIPERITSRLVEKITEKAIRASLYERMSKSVEPWLSSAVKFTLFAKSSWGIVNYNKTWKKSKITYRWCLTGAPSMSAATTVVSSCSQTLWNIQSFPPDLRQSFSKLSLTNNDWSFLGEDLANDISRKCSFYSSQISFFASTLPGFWWVLILSTRLALYLNITRPEDIKY